MENVKLTVWYKGNLGWIFLHIAENLSLLSTTKMVEILDAF